LAAKPTFKDFAVFSTDYENFETFYRPNRFLLLSVTARHAQTQ